MDLWRANPGDNLMTNIDLDIHTLKPNQFEEFKIVDIREPEECSDYAPLTEKIDFIPLSQIQERINFFNPENSYLLVCAKGGRSHYLAEILQSRGIHALSVNNGMASLNKYLEDNGYANTRNS